LGVGAVEVWLGRVSAGSRRSHLVRWRAFMVWLRRQTLRYLASSSLTAAARASASLLSSLLIDDPPRKATYHKAARVYYRLKRLQAHFRTKQAPRKKLVDPGEPLQKTQSWQPNISTQTFLCLRRTRMMELFRGVARA